MEQNNIDKLFRDKLGAKKVEFNPAAWAAAEELIAQQSAKKAWYANKTIWSVLALLLFLTGGTTWVSTNSESGLIDQNISSATQNAVDVVESENAQELNETSKVIAVASNTEISNQVDRLKQVPTQSKVENTSEFTNVVTKQQAITLEKQVDNELPHVPLTSNKKVTSKSTNRIQTILEMEKNERNIENIPLADLLGTNELVEESNFTQPVELPLNDRGLSILRNFDVRLAAGIGAVGGFRNPSDDSPVQIGYRPTVGLNIGYIVNSEFSFDINLLYSMRTGLSQEAMVLDPALANNTTQTLSLHYLDVPFYLNYHWERHAVQLGMQYSYLLTTQSQEISGTDAGTKNWGKNSYYKNSDLSGVIGYSFMLNEHLNLGARYNYGLFDVTGSQPSTWATNDRNHHFNILIEYKLSKY